MPPARRPTLHPLALCSLTLFAVLSACGGGGGDSSEPPAAPNSAPTLQLPNGLSGSGGSYTLNLPIGDSLTLTFQATDPENDPLQWQIVGATAAAATIGLTLPTMSAGPFYTLELTPVTAPATLSLVLLVQDPLGSAAAVDVLIVRTGAPTITAVTPGSAFASAPQTVTITGTALSLGGTATTRPRFGGQLGTFVTIPNETTLQCSTPSGMPVGPTVVSVSNVHGLAALPASAFTAYRFPPLFGAADSALDGGAGNAVALAQDGEQVHAVWLEGGVVVHRASTDGGTTWSTAQTLSGGEVPTEPQVLVTGQNVTAVWVGDGMTTQARSSGDGGATFDPAQVLNPLAGTLPAEQPRVCASGDRRYVAWLAGDPLLGAARTVVATSSDAGAVWSAPAIIEDGGANQGTPSIACDGATAWVAFTDERQGGGMPGAYTARTIDGGISWSSANRRSLPGEVVSVPRLCADQNDVHITWLRQGSLRFASSINAGAAWSNPGDMQSNAGGTISEPAIACAGNRLFTIYVAGGTAVWVSAITATGAAPRHVQLSTAAVAVGSPRIVHRGNYVFAAWRSDSVTTSAARILHSVSTDLGQTFTAPSGFGNPTAAQDQPRMLVDGARMLLCWLDYRGTTAALFTNRNTP